MVCGWCPWYTDAQSAMLPPTSGHLHMLFHLLRLPSPRLDLIDFISHCPSRKRKVFYIGILNEIYEGIAMNPAGTLRLPGANNSKSWNHGGGTTRQELCLQMMIIYVATLRTRNQKLARNNRERSRPSPLTVLEWMPPFGWIPPEIRRQEILREAVCRSQVPSLYVLMATFSFINMFQGCNLFLFSGLLDLYFFLLEYTPCNIKNCADLSYNHVTKRPGKLRVLNI